MLRGLTQLENLASFYHIYHFAIYGHGELLAVRLWPRWGAPSERSYIPGLNEQPIAHSPGQVGGPREGLYIVPVTFLH